MKKAYYSIGYVVLYLNGKYKELIKPGVTDILAYPRIDCDDPTYYHSKDDVLDALGKTKTTIEKTIDRGIEVYHIREYRAELNHTDENGDLVRYEVVGFSKMDMEDIT